MKLGFSVNACLSGIPRVLNAALLFGHVVCSNTVFRVTSLSPKVRCVELSSATDRRRNSFPWLRDCLGVLPTHVAFSGAARRPQPLGESSLLRLLGIKTFKDLVTLFFLSDQFLPHGLFG